MIHWLTLPHVLLYQETLAFQLFDVLYLQQGYSETRNTNRHYDALSYRVQSDTDIISKDGQFHMQRGSIAYFPSNTEYLHQARLDDVIVVHFKCFNFSGSRIEHYIPANPAPYEELFSQLLQCWKEKELDYMHQASIHSKCYAGCLYQP